MGDDLVRRVQVSMSSTSIVVKCLTDTKATGSSHGQITIGTLILQVGWGLDRAGQTCAGLRTMLQHALPRLASQHAQPVAARSLDLRRS